MAGTNHLGRKLWQTLSSIRTGVILLIVVVIVAAAGTMILQRPITDTDEMQRTYSPQVLRALDALQLTDVYHAWWFILLMVLVSCSIVAASIQRFPNSWRYFSRPYKSPNDSFRHSLATQATISIEDEETGVLAAASALRKLGYKPDLVTTEKHVSLFAERHRVSELAVYVVHASLLLIFMGGIIDGLFGWSGFVALTPGQQSSKIEMRNGTVRTLPFAVRCDSAGQENYADGSPKRWWSKLAIVQDGQDVRNKEIVVNDPLVYRAVRFYQASYGPTGKVEKITFSVRQANGEGTPRDIALAPEQQVQLDADTSVVLAEFIPDYVVRDNQVYTRSQSVDNPAVHLVVESKRSARPVNIWLPPIEGFAENALSTYVFEPQDLQMGHYTGLQVSHEPGQWGVWSGVVLMGIGLAFVFYLVHTRYWVVPVRDAHGHPGLWVGGTANRNREAFEENFKQLVEEIEAKLKAESAALARLHTMSMAGN